MFAFACAAALASTAGLSGCAAEDSQAPESELALEGSVRDDLTGKRLSGARVIFVSDTLDETEARSEGDGHFSMIVEVREGERFGTLHAERDGYQKSPAQTVYFDGTARTVELRMRASGD
jgi:hypothetical protein